MPMTLPTVREVLAQELSDQSAPLAFILAGHNGSGKSTLWHQQLADWLQVPMVNADRLTMSLLPEPAGEPPRLPEWAKTLRDQNQLWQRLSQQGIRLFLRTILKERAAFGFETVFSHWERLPNGRYRSKVDDLKLMQRAGYRVVLIFVGLTAVPLSILRVKQRRGGGGHDVPIDRLTQRFARTQAAIAKAIQVADLTLLVDNSLDAQRAFQFVRAQRRKRVLFDIRDPRYLVDDAVMRAAAPWLNKVAGN